MVNFYVNMIKNGRLQLEQVPDRWRADVEAALAETND